MPALDGMRILDLTQYEAGPGCTQALAWLGADVVKLERPRTGEPGRYVWGKKKHDSEYFVHWNSNKRSISIDLSRPTGRDLILRMLPRYDVFIENYGPGVIEKLDLGYDVLRAVHPGLIYARIKGFGTSGPYARYKCFDMVAQAAAGAFSVTGEPNGPPQRPGPTTGDSGTGIQLALAITAAYVQKLRTNAGQLIEISMQEAMTYYMRTMVAWGSNSGHQPMARQGNGIGATINLYPCTPFGPNDYVYIMAVTNEMWTRMCQVMERQALVTDPRFATEARRRKNSESLYSEIADWTRQHTKNQAMTQLAQAGVPCSAVLDTQELLSDPHLNAREFIHDVQHPDLGPVKVLGWAPRMSKSKVPIEPAPLLGEHTTEVLAADLGLTAGEIRALKKEGTID